MVSEEAQHRTTIMKTKSHSYSTEVKKPHTNYTKSGSGNIL